MKTGSAVQKLMWGYRDTDSMVIAQAYFCNNNNNNPEAADRDYHIKTWSSGYPTSGDPPACELKGRGNNSDVANVTQGTGLWQVLWSDLNNGKFD
jgi:hypothetical protein